MRVARGAESDPRLQLTEMTRQLSTMVVKVHSSDERAREMEARMSQALAASERLDNETQAMRFTMAGAQTREQEAKDKIDEMEGQLGSMMEGVDKWKREASVFRRESQARELAVKREQQLRVEAELERDKVARQVQGLKDLLVSAREDCERVKAEMEAQRLAHEKELLRMSQEKASTFSNITGSLAARRSRSRKGRTPNGERGASPALDDEKANLARSLRDFWAVGEEEEAAAATNEPPRSPSTGSRLGSAAAQDSLMQASEMGGLGSTQGSTGFNATGTSFASSRSNSPLKTNRLAQASAGDAPISAIDGRRNFLKQQQLAPTHSFKNLTAAAQIDQDRTEVPTAPAVSSTIIELRAKLKESAHRLKKLTNDKASQSSNLNQARQPRVAFELRPPHQSAASARCRATVLHSSGPCCLCCRAALLCTNCVSCALQERRRKRDAIALVSVLKTRITEMQHKHEGEKARLLNELESQRQDAELCKQEAAVLKATLGKSVLRLKQQLEGEKEKVESLRQQLSTLRDKLSRAGAVPMAQRMVFGGGGGEACQPPPAILPSSQYLLDRAPVLEALGRRCSPCACRVSYTAHV